MGRVPRGHSTGMRATPAEGLRGRRWARPEACRSSRRARIGVLVALGLSVGLLAGCGGGGDDRPAAANERQRTTTTAAAGETTTTLSARQREEQAVIQAHEAAVQARIDSAAPPTPDPDLPSLAETHTGVMLEQWKGSMTALRHNGFAIRYPTNSQHRNEVEEVTFDEIDGQQVAYVEVCTVDDGERFGVTSGEVLSSGVRTIQATEAMRKEGGVWKVAEVRENQRWDGVAGCAVD